MDCDILGLVVYVSVMGNGSCMSVEEVEAFWDQNSIGVSEERTLEESMIGRIFYVEVDGPHIFTSWKISHVGNHPRHSACGE